MGVRTIEQAELHAQLHELGHKVTDEMMRNAVRVGYEHMLTCTLFDAPSGAGFIQWDKTVATLREAFCGIGWRINNEGGYATVVDPTGKWAIAVASGDARTGLEGSPAPVTKWPKGSQTALRIHENQMCLGDLDEAFPRVLAGVPDESLTWMLLYHNDRQANEVRMELSLPDGMDSSRRVSSWKRRHILAAFTVERPVFDAAPEVDLEVEVPVERRIAQN